MLLQGRPRESLIKFDPPVDLGPAENVTSDIKAQMQRKPAVPTNVDSKPDTTDILHTLLPPVEWIEDNQHYVKYASNLTASRLDVLQLQELLDQRLTDRQARETGLCPVREELYAQTFDELIRQVTINCPERGLLLLRIRDEIRMTIAAYQTLYQSSVTFGTRKQLQAEVGKAETENEIAQLEESKSKLEANVVELKNKCESIERRETERRAIEERRRREEVDFLKHQGTHLENFLKGLN